VWAVEAVAMGAKKRRYTGELATPIVMPAPPTFWGAVTHERVRRWRKACQQHQQEAENRAAKKLLEKMSLLMKHYGIADENDMGTLAWILAYEHVPGFHIMPETMTRRGRKPKWDVPTLQKLLDTVNSLKRQHGFTTDRQALMFMVSNEQHAMTWGQPSSHKGLKQQWVESLESRLQDAKRYIARLASLHKEFSEIATAFMKKFRKL
jgi:hypothetical protein